MQTSIPGFVMKRKLTEDQFVRKTLINMYSAGDALEFIDTVELSNIQRSTSQFLLYYSSYDVEYSCEVGYDREEQYVANEKYYDKDLKKNIERPVIKTRTVTDWRPHTACEKGIPAATAFFICNDSPNSVEESSLYIRDMPEVENFPPKQLEIDTSNTVNFELPSDSQLKSADKICEDEAVLFVEQNRLPGDKQRGFIPQAVNTTDEHKMLLVAVEHWRADFELDGETCHATQYANKSDPSLCTNYKKSDKMDDELRKAEEEEFASHPDHKKYSKIGKYFSLGFIGGLLLAIILSTAFPGGFSMFLFVAAFASLGVSLFLKKKDNDLEKNIKDKYIAIRTNYKQSVCNRKIELLNARFAMMGQPPLTEEELGWFNPQTKRTLSGS